MLNKIFEKIFGSRARKGPVSPFEDVSPEDIAEDSLGSDIIVEEKARQFAEEANKYARMLAADPALTFIIQINKAPEVKPSYYAGVLYGDEVDTVEDRENAKRFRKADVLLLSYQVMKYQGMNPTILAYKEDGPWMS